MAGIAVLIIGLIINEIRIVDMRSDYQYDLRKYHLFRLHNGIKYERYILLGTAGLYSIYILSVCALDKSAMYNAINIQFLAVLFSLAVYCFTYTKMFIELHEQIMTATLIINSLFMVMIFLARTDEINVCNLPTTGVFLVLVCCYTIPIKFKTALVGGIASSLIFIAVPFYFGFIEEAFHVITTTVSLNTILSINAYNNITWFKENIESTNQK